MKLKGIWVAIAVICVAGIGVTNYSVRHLAAGGNEYVSELSEGSKESETMTIAEEAVAQAQGMQEAQEKAQVLSEAVQAEKGQAKAGQTESGQTSAGAGQTKSGQTWTGVGQTEEAQIAAGNAGASESQPLLKAAPSSEVQRSPEAGAAVQAQAMDESMYPSETAQAEKNGIMSQLAKLDEQAQSRREAAADGSANAMKAAADSERKIWENKLQGILEVLEQQLSGEEKNTFFAEQRSWVRDRESTAVSNSKRQNGSALEELEYIRFLRDITRERVYELAERYEAILDGKNE
ncbi:DUF1311 domain-containing protein [Clostridium sp. OM02-18AC]|uniref:lysozyme inhibitor LprI family protein n=1 Tax=Clostridium sp. OM02-18AC TaxID=2292311 RepID=UPI000E487274|nr:lysozyme inhibitor LprI family protein [Clostridium sp. OM02-18AC]RHV68950.1 DUF1311 domain-containing protein [Clostridium sp. OM02-18AC]